MIPLMDLKAQHDSIKLELDDVIEKVISNSRFIGGDELKDFERDFASYCETKHCIGVSNGSTALYIALKNLGVKEGDEVIMPVYTFAATAFAATLLGAKPVFVDVSEDDFLINVEDIEKNITPKTKVIVPVHLYGNVCNMQKIKEIAERHNLNIIEDCAQAHGAKYKGKKVPYTDIGTFSFFPSKNLGAMGDAGAIVSSDDSFSEKCRKFINHGRKEKYLHESEGFNFRIDNLQAAILGVKLKHLDEWIDKKRLVSEFYRSNIKGVKNPEESSDAMHVYHLYVIRSEKRDELQKMLKENGISSGVHYPIPLHLQPALSYLGNKEGDFPVAEKMSKDVLSIPISAEISKEDMEKVVSTINSFR